MNPIFFPRSRLIFFRFDRQRGFSKSFGMYVTRTMPCFCSGESLKVTVSLPCALPCCSYVVLIYTSTTPTWCNPFQYQKWTDTAFVLLTLFIRYTIILKSEYQHHRDMISLLQISRTDLPAGPMLRSYEMINLHLIFIFLGLEQKLL